MWAEKKTCLSNSFSIQCPVLAKLTEWFFSVFVMGSNSSNFTYVLSEGRWHGMSSLIVLRALHSLLLWTPSFVTIAWYLPHVRSLTGLLHMLHCMFGISFLHCIISCVEERGEDEQILNGPYAWLGYTVPFTVDSLENTVWQITNTENKKIKYNSEKANNTKYSKTKLPWFGRLLQHSARKRGGLILQRSHVLHAHNSNTT